MNGVVCTQELPPAWVLWGNSLSCLHNFCVDTMGYTDADAQGFHDTILWMETLLENVTRQTLPLRDMFARYSVELAYLYGSQARGEAGPLSDVDIALLFEKATSADERFRRTLSLMSELGSLFRRDDVQVVDLAEASPLLRYRVYQEGRLIYCKADAVRIHFETTALRDFLDTEPLRRIKRQYVLQRVAAP